MLRTQNLNSTLNLDSQIKPLDESLQLKGNGMMQSSMDLSAIIN